MDTTLAFARLGRKLIASLTTIVLYLSLVSPSLSQSFDCQSLFDRMAECGVGEIRIERITEIDQHRQLPYTYWRIAIWRNGEWTFEQAATVAEAMTNLLADMMCNESQTTKEPCQANQCAKQSRDDSALQ
jgi:hypothetical protein